MLKIALTHDVDRVRKSYQYLTYPVKNLIKLNIESFLYHTKSIFLKEPYWNFDKIIEIENYYDVKSTFFFLNETINFELFNFKNWKLSLGRYKITDTKISSIIKYLDTNGWEISLHGSYNSFNNKHLLKKEKMLLEKILGHPVIGTRQHYLNLNPDTWGIQKSLGFKYDSTYGYNNQIGFKDDKHRPFYPFEDSFTVFPLIIMDSCYMTTKNRWEEFIRLADLAEEKEGILVINWHQRDFNENEFPNHSKVYQNFIEEGKDRNAMFKTLTEYYFDNLDSKNAVSS